MKKLFKGLLNIPIPYSIAIGAISIILAVMAFQGELSIAMGVLIVLLVSLVAMQIHLGFVVLKSVVSILAIIYLTAIYTNIVMNIHGSIIEPFLLTLASVFVFVALTYSSKKHNYELRSRQIWSFVLAFILVITKLSFILAGYSLMIAEIVGLNLVVILIVLWLIWLNNSKKTKIIQPIIENEKIINQFKFIFINNQLDFKNKKWIGNHFGEDNNAYPFIYNEAKKASEQELSLVLVSTVTTDELYDIGEIKMNKARTILYLYMEAEDDKYTDDILKSFYEEISRYNN